MTPDARVVPSRRYLILACRVAIVCTWIALLWLSLYMNGGRLALEEGRTNGESSAFWGWMACALAGLFIGIVFFVSVVLRAIWSLWLERFVLFVAVLFIFVFAALFGGPDRNTAYLSGLKQWASGINPEQVRSWEKTLRLGSAAATPPPYWWRMKDLDLPFGVSAPPVSSRALFSGPLPDEVRVFPTNGRVIFGWGFSGSYSRVVVILGTGESAPPAEFDTALLNWVRLSDEVWMGIQFGH